MKRYLSVVVLVLIGVMALSSCGDSKVEKSDISTNVEFTNADDKNDVPEYVQQVYDRYTEKIEKHGDLVREVSSKIKKENYESFSYSFSLFPTKGDSFDSRVLIFFDEGGNQTFYVSAEKATSSYREELLALTLLVIDPEMQISDTKEIVDRLSSSFYVDGKREKESDKVVVGDYTVYFIANDVWPLGVTINVESTKTAYDIFDFDKSSYQILTPDIYANPTGFENKQFYIEGTFGYSADGMTAEITDTEGNHFTIEEQEYLCRKGAMYRLYGRLKTDVYGDAYFYVEYRYGL